MKTLIIGVGNPIASEDMFGILVAQKLERILSDSSDVEIDYCVESGVRLAEKLIGYDEVIIVDAIRDKNNGKQGIKIIDLSEWDDEFKTPLIPHDFDFLTAVKIMKEAFKEEFPKRIIILGYFLSKKLRISDDASRNFLSKVDEAVRIILGMVKKNEVNY